MRTLELLDTIGGHGKLSQWDLVARSGIIAGLANSYLTLPCKNALHRGQQCADGPLYVLPDLDEPQKDVPLEGPASVRFIDLLPRALEFMRGIVVRMRTVRPALAGLAWRPAAGSNRSYPVGRLRWQDTGVVRLSLPVGGIRSPVGVPG